MSAIPLKTRQKSVVDEPRWIKPTNFSKIFGKSPATIINKIRDAQAGKKQAPFIWKEDKHRPNKFLVYYDPANPPQKVLNPHGAKIDEYIKSHAGTNFEDINKKLQAIADTDQAIKQEKLKKLQIENKEKEGKYVDKEKFNRDFFAHLRAFRNKAQSLPKRWRVKMDKLTPHQFEQMLDKDFDKLFIELSEFKYYDSNDNKN